MSRRTAGTQYRRALAGVLQAAVLTAGAPLVGAPLAGARPSPAQDPERPAGWLGVRVSQNVVCTWETSESEKECELVLDVSEVKEGGPAEVGGLEPGDRMIAINGQDITFMTWDPLRESIRAGTPVSIDVMRDDARYFARVTPTERTPNIERGRWVGVERRTRVAAADRPSAFVVTLTPLERSEGGAAFAITVRDTDDDEVEFEPAALRVLDGRLRLVPLDDETARTLDLRREIVGTLRGITNSSYERASNAVQVVDNIRARLPSDDELRERLSWIAQVGLEEARLATTFNRSWAGALFEPAGRDLASAVEAGRAGLLVVRVIANTPAARLGLREGDIVFEAGETAIRDLRDLQWAIESARGPVEIRWLRKGLEMSATYRR
ncbi:MAG: PDZ domain-containing protein [Gemmatimonadota bacterium]|nr:PDZ domain-containing protein [Gemmatimonadota bacterium]